MKGLKLPKKFKNIKPFEDQLKDGDMKMFEKVLGQLQDLPKSSRARVLAALEKVFA